MKIKRMGAALAAVTLLLTAACGDESGNDPDSAASPSVAEESASGEPTQQSPSDEPSADKSEGADVDPRAFGRAVIEAQLEAGTVHMEGSFGQGVTMTGVMSLAGDEPAMDMKLSGAQVGGSGVHMILVDGTMYIQIPGSGVGNKFLKVDSKDMANNPLAKSLESIDPSRTFRAFEAITSLEQVGEDTVAGAATVHYKITVDTAKSLQAQGIDPSQAGALPPEIRYDLWVGQDDLVRKMVMGPEAGSVEMVLTKWGEPVQISAPPPGQVQEMPRG